MLTQADREKLISLQKEADQDAQEAHRQIAKLQAQLDQARAEREAEREKVVYLQKETAQAAHQQLAILQAQIDAVAPDTNRVSIDVSCQNNDISIGLTDGNAPGKPAWAVRRHPNKSITWDVPQNVTIESIKGKTVPLPIDVDPNNQGGTPGKPFKATVQANPPGGATTTYDYLIELTFKMGGQTTRLVLDPEFIVNKP